MKLGGIGDLISASLKERTANYNDGRSVDTVNQKLGYLVRCGDPDAIDAIVPMAYGNLALDLILKKTHGRLVVLKNGRYDNIPVDIVLGLAPYWPPHLLEKLGMLFRGRLVRPLDWFDLFLHSAPWLLLILKAVYSHD